MLLPVDCPNANQLNRRTLMPKAEVLQAWAWAHTVRNRTDWHERRKCNWANHVFQTLNSMGIMDQWNNAIILAQALKLRQYELPYRVSHNIVSPFLLLISLPPKHLEVPSWTFFNSPFNIDFKTIQFIMI